MKKLNIIYIFDNYFSDVAGVSLTSLLYNNPVDEIELTIYLLTVNLDGANLEKINKIKKESRQRIIVIDASKTYEKILQLGLTSYRGSAMTNLRLYFNELVPIVDLERMLYIDCDTIVCDSLNELADFDMKHKLMGMVYDPYGKIMRNKKHTSELYYGAGIILIDCKRWVNEKWIDKITDFIKNNSMHLAHPDQDLLNIVCEGEIITLPIKYNFQPVHKMYNDDLYFKILAPSTYYSCAEIQEARNAPVIVHMIRTLGCNPWEEQSIHPDNDLFRKYKNISEWKDTKYRKIKNDIVIKIERGLFKILPTKCFFSLHVFVIKIVQFLHRGNKY